MTPAARLHAARALKDRAYGRQAKDVRYVVVGGEAVILHGHVRLTGDVDVYYSSDSEDLRLLFAALESFWDGDVPGAEGPRIWTT